MKIWIVATAAFLAGVGPALAEEPNAAIARMLACDFVDGSKARLKCFDAALAALRSAYPEAAALANAEREEIARLAAQQKEADFGLRTGESDLNSFVEAADPGADGEAQDAPPAESGDKPARLAEEEIDSIDSTAVTAGRNNAGRVFVVLENGQIWRQLKSDSSRPIISRDGEGQTVSIRRGALGSFFVKIGKTPAFRAERIK